MSQAKEQDITTEKQLSEVEIGKLPEKELIEMIVIDGPRSQKMSGTWTERIQDMASAHQRKLLAR